MRTYPSSPKGLSTWVEKPLMKEGEECVQTFALLLRFQTVFLIPLSTYILLIQRFPLKGRIYKQDKRHNASDLIDLGSISYIHLS
jgi:hypothetical protein